MRWIVEIDSMKTWYDVLSGKSEPIVRTVQTGRFENHDCSLYGCPDSAFTERMDHYRRHEHWMG